MASTQERVLLLAGSVCIAIGLLCNQWILTRLFSPDGQLTLVNKIIIAMFNVTSLTIGYLLLTKRKEGIRYFVELYRSFTLICFNVLVLLVLTNFVIYMGGMVTLGSDAASSIDIRGAKLFEEDGRPVDNGRRTALAMGWFDYTAYGDYDPAYVGEVLDEFWSLEQKGFFYQPWVQHTEPLFQGELVSIVSDAGGLPIRNTLNPSQDSTKAVIRIYAFGGSTTFGYLVSDEHTWPTYLSRVLNERARAQKLDVQVEVVNYGKGWFAPSQETILLIDLLKSGHRPSLVIFMDGVNSWGPGLEDVPSFTQKAEKGFLRAQHGFPDLTTCFDWLPLTRIARPVLAALHADRNSTRSEVEEEDNRWIGVMSDESDVDMIVRRFRYNRKISKSVSNMFGVHTLFILQPDVFYNYPLHLFRPTISDAVKRPLFNEKVRALRRMFHHKMKEEKDIIYLGDLFHEWGDDRKAIIDSAHYSPAFHRFLAERVADYIDLRKLTPSSKPIDSSIATGGIRGSATRQARLLEEIQTP